MHKPSKNFKVLISQEEIAQRIVSLGQEISHYYRDQSIIAIGVLKGSFVFLADLVRSISSEIHIDFVGISSYSGFQSTQEIKLTRDLSLNIEGKNVLVVEDIIDTGLTISYLQKYLIDKKGALDVKTAAFLSKPLARKVECSVDWVGFEIGNEFVIGYGLDYNERYRELPHIALYEE